MRYAMDRIEASPNIVGVFRLSSTCSHSIPGAVSVSCRSWLGPRPPGGHTCARRANMRLLQAFPTRPSRSIQTPRRWGRSSRKGTARSRHSSSPDRNKRREETDRQNDPYARANQGRPEWGLREPIGRTVKCENSGQREAQKQESSARLPIREGGEESLHPNHAKPVSSKAQAPIRGGKSTTFEGDRDASRSAYTSAERRLY